MNAWTQEQSDANYRRCMRIIRMAQALTAINIVSAIAHWWLW